VKNISHDGNISLDDVIAIARIMRPRSMARELKGTVREILGTCQSVGCTVDGDSATDMLAKVRARVLGCLALAAGGSDRAAPAC
jgi:large subunit ribosomal protein L12e